MSSAFRAEQLDAGVGAGFAGQEQQQDYQQQLFSSGNGEFFAAKQSGNEQSADLHSLQFVDAKNEKPKSNKDVDAKPVAQDAKDEPLLPLVSWKIDVKDTPGGGKHMGIKGRGEGDLVKQADGSFKGDLVDSKGEKTAVKINPDGTVSVDFDGDEFQFKLKADGTVDSVTNLDDAIYQRTERPDGTGEMKFKDGSLGYTFRYNSDGSEDRQYADGSTEHSSEGGSLRKFPNGSTREQMADGTTVYVDAVTGVVVRSTRDHITTINYKDGTKITKLPDGTSITRDPDGTTRTQKFDGSDTKLPDGTVVRTTQRPNGLVHIEVVPPGQKPVQHKPATAQKPRANPVTPPGDATPRPQGPGADNKPPAQGQPSPAGDANVPFDPADRKPGR